MPGAKRGAVAQIRQMNRPASFCMALLGFCIRLTLRASLIVKRLPTGATFVYSVSGGTGQKAGQNLRAVDRPQGVFQPASAPCLVATVRPDRRMAPKYIAARRTVVGARCGKAHGRTRAKPDPKAAVGGRLVRATRNARQGQVRHQVTLLEVVPLRAVCKKGHLWLR